MQLPLRSTMRARIRQLHHSSSRLFPEATSATPAQPFRPVSLQEEHTERYAEKRLSFAPLIRYCIVSDYFLAQIQLSVIACPGK